MPYINRKTWTKILKARKDGDVDASAIYDKFFDKNCRQEELDRLVGDYLSPAKMDPQALDAIKENQEIAKPEPESETEPEVSQVEIVDISPDLDKELDGLIDDDEIDDDDFDAFIKKKKKNANRLKKNADYFAAFDPEGRKNYYVKKTEEKNHQYDDKRRDIERAFNDMGVAIGKYSQSVKDLPEDELKYNSDGTDKAYDSIIGIGKSFGRSWDEQDVLQVVSVLKDLVSKFGKKNVLAALNLISQDNQSYRNDRIGSIDKAVKKYSEGLKNLIGGK